MGLVVRSSRGETFLSTPSARRATKAARLTSRATRISIHALREEGDLFTALIVHLKSKFLSTPSARRATQAVPAPHLRLQDFYPRPPRGGRRHGENPCHSTEQFLSTPSARRATSCNRPFLYPWEFLSTPSARRATAALPSAECLEDISIHALREEGDTVCFSPNSSRLNFYPRPPRGGRQQKQRQNLYFQTNYTTFCTNLEEL